MPFLSVANYMLISPERSCKNPVIELWFNNISYAFADSS